MYKYHENLKVNLRNMLVTSLPSKTKNLIKAKVN